MVLSIDEAIPIDVFNFRLSLPAPKELMSFLGKIVTLRIYNPTSNSEVISLLPSTAPPFSFPFLSILNMPDDFVLKYPFLYSHLQSIYASNKRVA